MSLPSSLSRSLVRLHRPVLHLALIATALTITGCASLSKSECLKGDWAAIGKSDGYGGRSPTRIDDHVEACAEYGVRPDLAAYRQGYRQGLVFYCTGAKGFEDGRFSHLTYYGQCPQPAEATFLAGREMGSDAANIDNEIAGLDSRIRDLQKQYKDKDTPDGDRKGIAREISDLDHRRAGLYTDLDRLLDRARARGYY
ncbi:hypothetical protein BH09PSE6_BH09PSE6_04270 [soil metagenome]